MSAFHVGELIVPLKFQLPRRLPALGWPGKNDPHFYIAAILGALVLGLALGFALHRPNRSASTADMKPPISKATVEVPTSPGTAPAPIVALTEVVSEKRRGRNGETDVAVKIGVAPQARNTKGEVEIRVYFFDVSQAGELRPTTAQVDYDWLTPVRDWSDPTPKFLVATYRGAPVTGRTLEKLRYGGFIVRVYFDGKLQDERSEPTEIAAALRRVQPAASAGLAAPASAATSPIATAEATPPANREPVTGASVAPSPTATSVASRNAASTAPFASPVPGKPGFVYSPYDEKFLIDVRGVPPGMEMKDPNTGKPLRVP